MIAPEIEYPRAPAHIDAYVNTLGPAGAMEFLLAFGGSEIYPSTNPKSRSMIVDKIGYDKAVALAAALGAGTKVRVPTAKPWIACCMAAEGLQTAEIARRLHTTDTTVRGWLKAGPARPARVKIDPRQMHLF